MSIDIQVNHAYAKPDLYVNGLITAYPEEREVPFKAASLLVSMVGRSKTHIVESDGKIHERCNTFFEMSREVYPGQAELRWGQQTTWSLHLPNDPAAPRPSEEELIWTWNIDKPPPQALPSSGEYGRGNLIEYEVQACMLDQSRIIREVRSKPLLVQFSQTRVEEDLDHEMASIIQEQQIEGPETLDGDTSFDVALDIPQVVVQERGFPLLLRLVSHHSNVTRSLKTCSLQLIENTLITSEENTSDRLTNNMTLGSWTANTADSSSDIFMTSNTTLDLNALLDRPIVPVTCTPSFDCGNIRRSYAFLILIKVSYEGRTYNLTYDVNPVIVYAAETVNEAKAKQREELLALNDDGWD